jgi:hypothetical protein
MSAKSRAITESGAARPGDSQGRNLQKPREIPASPTLCPSIDKPMLDGQAELPPDRNPSCVAAEESGRRLARAVLESMDAIKPDAVTGRLRRVLLHLSYSMALSRLLDTTPPRFTIAGKNQVTLDQR